MKIYLMARYLEINKKVAFAAYINIDLIWKIEVNNNIGDEDSKGVFIFIEKKRPIHLKISFEDFIQKCKSESIEF